MRADPENFLGGWGGEDEGSKFPEGSDGKFQHCKTNNLAIPGGGPDPLSPPLDPPMIPINLAVLFAK